MRPLRLLFETREAAREVAFMLRCEYDGCTLITLPPVYDTVALRVAIELTGADFCFDGDHYPLVLPPLKDELTQGSHPPVSDLISRKAELWCNEVPF
ncbi:hypothetical protein H6G89_07000 [Oscillatoria sp. FACHB-1407]|uniref:hypothetical protein n=1 Tax=Oscillatoria sp. FACHB-1407 TaxID=2692847 RepID=UPI001688164A|nr:hypothetical protein [Oscillatoria sp. FACHB-1407]MBD2460789.1 hypothetical protein [Oscillatoria sp. FACHB-1407]